MTTETTNTVHTINAAGMRLGTVATKAAHLLQGKSTPDYTKHNIAKVTVKIENASKLDVTEKKKKDIYQSYSGYPGGRREETLEHLGKRLGYSEVVRRTIKGMLPANRLRTPIMKNLIVTE